METITPIPQTRLKIPDAPPEASPENPRERFAQVMARQEKFSRPKENSLGLDRRGPIPKTPLTPEEKSKKDGPDPATDPEVTSHLTAAISNAVPPSPPTRPEEPPVSQDDPTFSLKLAAQTLNPALVPTEQINPSSKIRQEPGDLIIKNAAPVVRGDILTESADPVKPLDSPLPGTPGETKGPVPLAGLLAQVREDFRIINKTGPAVVPASIRPEGTSKESPVFSKAVEDLTLHPAPESLITEHKVSPEITENGIKSSQTTTENDPSFSPQGPAIPKTASIVDGLDPSPSLILRKFVLKGQDSEPPTASEIKPESQASPSEASSRTEKGAVAPSSTMEGPPIVEADPVGSNSNRFKVPEKAVSPATSKEILSDRGIPSLEKAEGPPPDPEKTSRTLAGLDPKTAFLHKAAGEKVEPGSSLRDPGEKLFGSGGPEMNNPIRFQEDTPLGVMGKFPDPSRIEGVPADRVVEGPPKASPEWIKEAFSVYQQYSKGLLRNLQQGGERIQMTLDPPQLGNILMEINRDRNFVTAHLWTDNPHTKELLDFSQGQLQKTLELDGFKLDRFEVLVQPDLKSFQEERWFGGRQPAWENNRQEGSRAAPAGLSPTAPGTATLRFSQGNQYVDTWV